MKIKVKVNIITHHTLNNNYKNNFNYFSFVNLFKDNSTCAIPFYKEPHLWDGTLVCCLIKVVSHPKFQNNYFLKENIGLLNH